MTKKKGGSVASDSVNAFVPNFIGKPCLFNKQLSIPNTIDKQFLKQNYGASFKTTGGRKKNKKNTKKNIKNGGGNNIYDTFQYYPVPYMGKYMNTYPYYAVNQYNKPLNNINVMRGGSADQINPGDSNPLTGASVPPTIAQKIQQNYAGETRLTTDSRSDVTFPSGLQLACDNYNCLKPINTPDSTNSIRNIKGNLDLNIPNTEGYTFELNKPEIPDNIYNLPAPRAGGKQNKSKKKNKINKKGGDTNGLSSDFQSVLHSRGPYNYPDAGWHIEGQDAKQANYQQFLLFNKTSPYIPPSQLSNGSAQFTQAPLKLTPDPYMSNPYIASEEIKGFNQPNGVNTSSFNGGKKNLNIKYKNVI